MERARPTYTNQILPLYLKNEYFERDHLSATYKITQIKQTKDQHNKVYFRLIYGEPQITNIFKSLK